MCYPDSLIRGISHPNLINDDGLPGADLFPFDKESTHLPGYHEESINWCDDQDAIRHTFDQKKDDGDFQFKAGIAILPRSELDRFKYNAHLKNRFDYERCCRDTNKYHGNLLLKKDTPKQVKRVIAGTLALFAQVIKREDYETASHETGVMGTFSS